MPSLLGSLVKSFSSDNATTTADSSNNNTSEANVEVCLSPTKGSKRNKNVASKFGFDDNDILQVEIGESIPDEVIDESNNAQDGDAVVKQDSSLSSEDDDDDKKNDKKPSSNPNEEEDDADAVDQEVKKEGEKKDGQEDADGFDTEAESTAAKRPQQQQEGEDDVEEKKDDQDDAGGDDGTVESTAAKQPQQHHEEGEDDTHDTNSQQSQRQLDEEEKHQQLGDGDIIDDDPNSATIIEFTNLAMAVAKGDHQEESKGSSSGKGRRRLGGGNDGSTARGDDGSTSNGSTVSFGSVHTREYERVIDSTNMYLGLALGWDYNQKPPTPIKSKNRTGRYLTPMSTAPNVEPLPDSKSCEGRALMKRTNGSDRYRMYTQYGYTRKDLKKATNEAAKFYKQRQKEATREAARALVAADERTKGGNAAAKDKRQSQRSNTMFRSMFHR